MAKDTSWHRFFNPEKSPHTFWNINAFDGRVYFEYIAKHVKRLNNIPIRQIWDSKKQGTYIRNKTAEA